RFLETESASGNFIQTTSDKLVALIGVENLAVVETDDALMVCSLDRAQEVKQVVESLEKSEEKKRFL
ncbi:MAG: mannose-1-phosphate guanylyltransferase, partial [Balneolaceae bacterium]|nr:mannose-1-phosphate guanylyltransferase [Balneolaceae bacterium]